MLNVYRFKYHFCHVIHICTHTNRYECSFCCNRIHNKPTNQHTSFQFLMLHFALFVLSSYPYTYSFPIFSMSAFYNDFSCIFFSMEHLVLISMHFSTRLFIFPHICCILFFKLEIFSFFSLFVSYCGIIF